MQVAEHDARYELTTLRSAAGVLRVPSVALATGARLRVHIRARDVMIGLSAPDDLSALNVLHGTVAELGHVDGPIVDIRIDLNGETLLARVTRLTVDRLGLAPGRRVFAIIKSIALDRRSLGQGRPDPDSGASPLDDIAL
jgi:molybdate transport system ATP-binding protein